VTQRAIQWDGRTYPYIPNKELKIHPSLKRHSRAAEKVDPVTYEVVRHAMWNLNVEHRLAELRLRSRFQSLPAR
jgi:hypothetical protein